MAYIQFTTQNQVATITLDNPAKRNALEPALREELAAAIVRVRDDHEIRALILTGAGQHFSSGGDLKNIGSVGLDGEGWRKRMQHAHRWVRELITLEKPVIAAVDGVVYGAGFSLALMADFILATPRSRFCMSFVRVGFVPDLGAFYTLPRVVGTQRARELMLSGRELDGEEAQRLGIAMELVPPEQLMARARAIADSMVHASPAVVSMVKRTLAVGGPELSALLELEANAQAVASGTPAHKEAVQRFLDKQPALFQWPAK